MKIYFITFILSINFLTLCYDECEDHEFTPTISNDCYNRKVSNSETLCCNIQMKIKEGALISTKNVCYEYKKEYICKDYNRNREINKIQNDNIGASDVRVSFDTSKCNTSKSSLNKYLLLFIIIFIS